QGRRIWQELERGHQALEPGPDLADLVGAVPERGLDGGDMARDAAEQLLRRLHHDALVASEVARAKHRKRIFGERRRHLWTVRSGARARTRPHGLVVLVTLAILGLLAVLAARVDAHPVVDPDAPPAGATAADPDEPAPDDDARPFPYVPRP